MDGLVVYVLGSFLLYMRLQRFGAVLNYFEVNFAIKKGFWTV